MNTKILIGLVALLLVGGTTAYLYPSKSGVEAVIATSTEPVVTRDCDVRADSASKRSVSAFERVKIPAKCPIPGSTPDWKLCVDAFLLARNVASGEIGKEVRSQVYQECVSK